MGIKFALHKNILLAICPITGSTIQNFTRHPTCPISFILQTISNLDSTLAFTRSMWQE